jgi:hypothetical protein
VLPLLTKKLHITLSPECVTITQQTNVLMGGKKVSKSMPCPIPKQNEQTWAPALSTLQLLLAQEKIQNINAVVSLSNHFVRYQLIKHQPDLSGLDEEQAFVRFSFKEIYGEEVNSWHFKWGAGLQYSAQIACAIESKLIEQIEAILFKAGVKLNSMQPYLMCAFNFVRKFIDSKPHWFVLVEQGNALIGLTRNGEWQLLHSSRLGVDWVADLSSLIRREIQIAGLIDDSKRMMICLPKHVDHTQLKLDKHALRISCKGLLSQP